jgi:hypothetical protein
VNSIRFDQKRVKVSEAWERMQWCYQTLGEPGRDTWIRDRGWLCFARPEYRTMYLLRWA